MKPRPAASPRAVAVSDTINEYLSRSDWRVNANANQGYSLGGMILNTAGKIIANYWLDEVYSPEAGAAHRDGDIHIHDLDMFAGYCAGWSLRTLLEQGFNGIPGRISSAPPRHLSAATGQMVNFLGTLQNEWAGAQAFSSVDTYLAPFVRIDGLSYDQVLQAVRPVFGNSLEQFGADQAGLGTGVLQDVTELHAVQLGVRRHGGEPPPPQ